MVWWFNERECHVTTVESIALKWARAFTQTKYCAYLTLYETSWARRLHITAVVVTTHRRKKRVVQCHNTQTHTLAHIRECWYTSQRAYKQYTDKVKQRTRVLCLLSVAYTVWLCLCTFIYIRTYTYVLLIFINVKQYVSTYICLYVLLDSNVCVPVNFQFVHSIVFSLSFPLPLYVCHCDLFFLSTLLPLLFFNTIYCSFFEKVFFSSFLLF